MPNTTSAPGDCFSRIAKANGFFNYLSVYTHDDNATTFPNPNQLEGGSTVKVPEKKMKAFDLPLDAEKKLKIVRKKTRLRVKLVQADVAKTPGIAKATLKIGDKKASGTTGSLDLEDIDPALTTASLTVTLSNPPPYAKAPATAKGAANQHPPPIVADDFDDPETVWPKKGATLSWDLQVGHLEPHTTTTGILQRLENLGFTCPVQKAEDDDTRRAVRTYRRFVENQAPPADTGAVADIRANIKARHDD